MLLRLTLALGMAVSFAGCDSPAPVTQSPAVAPSPAAPAPAVAPPPMVAVPPMADSVPTADSAPHALPLREWLSVKELRVRVMREEVSPRSIELMEKLQAAIRKDPQWWMEHAKKARPGQPIDYDPRLGLTEGEFAEFLDSMDELSLTEGPEVTMGVVENPPGVFTLDGRPTLADFTGVTIDLNQDQVSTPYGATDNKKLIDTDESILGPWQGVEWKLETAFSEGPPPTGTIVKFAMGRRKQESRGVLIYDVRQLSADGGTRISHILTFDLNHAPSAK